LVNSRRRRDKERGLYRMADSLERELLRSTGLSIRATLPELRGGSLSDTDGDSQSWALPPVRGAHGRSARANQLSFA
jgi:hypothetical protein